MNILNVILYNSVCMVWWLFNPALRLPDNKKRLIDWLIDDRKTYFLIFISWQRSRWPETPSRRSNWACSTSRQICRRCRRSTSATTLWPSWSRGRWCSPSTGRWTSNCRTTSSRTLPTRCGGISTAGLRGSSAASWTWAETISDTSPMFSGAGMSTVGFSCLLS